MIVKEISVKSVLSKSQVYDYAMNPYRGCSHGCRYCYAAFMKRFTGHREPWGEFVDVKINAPELLAKEIERKPVGRVWVSGVCDPYQPVEKEYRLTRKCLEVLLGAGWPVTVQTKSSLVLRDIDLLRTSGNVEAGFSITTADEKIRQIFEPGASPIGERIEALNALHGRGIKTFAMIAPILPGAERLPDALEGAVDYVLVDRLNYHYANRVYREQNLAWAVENRFFSEMGRKLADEFRRKGIPLQLVF
ncbi:MAG TPA: radical SAM protein [Syntrophales bacterium]|jgi:DNA repair photolyase|nr:radical SAM protein [Syntrophales bacterium]HQA83563.1 radical SAM protein [Syntrophales bacterium]